MSKHFLVSKTQQTTVEVLCFPTPRFQLCIRANTKTRSQLINYSLISISEILDWTIGEIRKFGVAIKLIKMFSEVFNSYLSDFNTGKVRKLGESNHEVSVFSQNSEFSTSLNLISFFFVGCEMIMAWKNIPHKCSRVTFVYEFEKHKSIVNSLGRTKFKALQNAPLNGQLLRGQIHKNQSVSHLW